MAKFRSFLNPGHAVPGMYNTGSKVQRGGVIPLHVRIGQMVAAGERLYAQREQFDTFEPDVFPPTNPLRRKDVDMSEVSAIKRGLEAKVTAVSRTAGSGKPSGSATGKPADKKDVTPEAVGKPA